MQVTVAQDLEYKAVVGVKNLSYRLVWDPEIEEYVKESIDLFADLEINIRVHLGAIPGWESLEGYPFTEGISIPADKEGKYEYIFKVPAVLAEYPTADRPGEVRVKLVLAPGTVYEKEMEEVLEFTVIPYVKEIVPAAELVIGIEAATEVLV